jgi:hypothetical protein
MKQLTAADSSSLRNRISKPDEGKYKAVRDAREWLNPYLIVKANGIEVRAPGSEWTTVPPSAVVGFLEGLPATAWPYGLVVGVQENSLRSGDDTAHIKQNLAELLSNVRAAGIKAEMWPS